MPRGRIPSGFDAKRVGFQAKSPCFIDTARGADKCVVAFGVPPQVVLTVERAQHATFDEIRALMAKLSRKFDSAIYNIKPWKPCELGHQCAIECLYSGELLTEAANDEKMILSRRREKLKAELAALDEKLGGAA